MPGSERVLYLIEQLKSKQLVYETIEAVVGKNLTDEEIQDSVSLRGCYARLGYRISPGAIGCGLSHRKVYEIVVENKIDWALILEEDASLSNFNEDVIMEVVGTQEASATIIQLFSRGSRLVLKSKVPSDSVDYNLFEFGPRLIGSGTSAYLINYKAAQVALDSRKLVGAPDWPSWAKSVNFKLIFPWMTFESSVDSTIESDLINRRQYITRRLMQFSGLHYLIYKSEYSGIKDYVVEEVIPFIYHSLWKIKGSKFYKKDRSSFQIL